MYCEHAHTNELFLYVGVTSRLDAKFMKSISTDEPQLMIRGRMIDRKRNAIFIETEIYNSANELCTRAEMVYFITPQERAMEEFGFCGCKTEDEISINKKKS